MRVMQGLQRNVIGMALCCKKGGGQSIMGATATAKATHIAWYCRITVLRRDWVVVAGLRIRLTGWSARTTSDTVLRRRLVTACHGRCLYIGRASACAFTTTVGALTGGTALTNRQRLTGHFNALTCCVLCFAEPAAGDQAAPMWNLFSALCPCHNIESTAFISKHRARCDTSSNALIVASSSLPRCHT